MDHVECVVVGAGVVGLAITRALARAGRHVLAIDAASGLGAGTSGRGSGVIHAGLYYPEGSLKARLCIEGRDALYDFADAHGVPHRRLGKLVVASAPEEEKILAGIAARAQANGVVDLVALDGSAARAMEPELHCTAALHSPSTGVVDAQAFMRALLDDAEEFGAVSAFEAPLQATRVLSRGFELAIGGATPMHIGCAVLVNAAGHGAPGVARAIDAMPLKGVPTGYFAKGNYFEPSQPVPFSRLIYPVPVPGGMGSHLTLDTAGRPLFGPDVEWVEIPDDAVDPARAARMEADVRRWWPGLPEGSLRPARAGVRPKIAGPGEPGRDFVIEGAAAHGIAGLVNLYGIESPGLTAALALGDHVERMVA